MVSVEFSSVELLLPDDMIYNTKKNQLSKIHLNKIWGNTVTHVRCWSFLRNGSVNKIIDDKW